MLTILTALYAEAKPAIELLKLKKIREPELFDVFENDDLGVRLAVSGTGAVPASVCVTRLFTKYKPDAGDILMNVGACAGEPDRDPFVLCGKIVEESTGRTFYPDLLFRHPHFHCPEAAVISVPKVITGGIGKRKTEAGLSALAEVYDLEAAAVYQAASYFIAPHQMFFYKVITDAGFGNRVTARMVEEKVRAFWESFFFGNETCGEEGRAERIKNILTALSDFGNCETDRFAEFMPSERAGKLYRDFCCSEAMKHNLMQHLRYFYLRKTDVDKVLREAYREKLLPAKDKRAGKQAMEHVFSRLKEAPERLDCIGEPERSERTERGGKPGNSRRAEYSGDLEKLTGSEKSALIRPAFSVIYVEERIADHALTKEILNRFPDALKISVGHYKDVFCRKKQSVSMQERGKALILAEKTGELIYKGAKVCQNFNREYFYYTSCVMNCIYHCEYCYLKGMYPSADLVVFVNLEDIFAGVDRLLALHPVYLCVSYDTDLMALESVTGFVKKWVDFAKERENLLVEIRTKCGRSDLWEHLAPAGNVIFAFTLSPERVAERYEHGAASLSGRIDSLVKAYEAGFRVRLCFDPVIYCKNWRRAYDEMLNAVFERVDMKKIMDVSIGSFRISQDYLKRMRKAAPNAEVVQYPYEKREGVYQYEAALQNEMESALLSRIREKIPEDKIFYWSGSEQSMSGGK